MFSIEASTTTTGIPSCSCSSSAWEASVSFGLPGPTEISSCVPASTIASRLSCLPICMPPSRGMFAQAGFRYFNSCSLNFIGVPASLSKSSVYMKMKPTGLVT